MTPDWIAEAKREGDGNNSRIRRLLSRWLFASMLTAIAAALCQLIFAMPFDHPGLFGNLHRIVFLALAAPPTAKGIGMILRVLKVGEKQKSIQD